jgi:pheromone shutdown protein TraB
MHCCHCRIAQGEEFRVALREAHAIGAQVVLGDRLLSITLARVWAALGMWEKVKLTGSLLWTGLR